MGSARRVRRRTPRGLGAIVGDWATWGIRALIPALAYLAYQSYQELNHVAVQVAVLDAKVDNHTSQLSAIWQRLPPNPPPPAH